MSLIQFNLCNTVINVLYECNWFKFVLFSCSPNKKPPDSIGISNGETSQPVSSGSHCWSLMTFLNGKLYTYLTHFSFNRADNVLTQDKNYFSLSY